MPWPKICKFGTPRQSRAISELVVGYSLFLPVVLPRSFMISYIIIKKITKEFLNFSEVKDDDQVLKIPMYFSVKWKVNNFYVFLVAKLFYYYLCLSVHQIQEVLIFLCRFFSYMSIYSKIILSVGLSVRLQKVEM